MTRMSVYSITGLMLATLVCQAQTYPRRAPAAMPQVGIPYSTVPAGEAKPLPRVRPVSMQVPQMPAQVAPQMVPPVTVPYNVQSYPAPNYNPMTAPLSAPASCENCQSTGGSYGGRVGPTSYGERLRSAWYEHICAPDGCPTPLGCGNFWTEKKFIFGSCRQFFGTTEATVGQHRGTYIP